MEIIQMCFGFRLMWPALLSASLLVGTAAPHSNAQATRTLQVGPGKTFARPSQAAAVAKNGDTVEISATTYSGDVAVWTASNLTLRGVGGQAHLRADGASAQGKAIWVIQGSNTTVENIEFSGTRVPDNNGAGIRQEGAGLTVRNCYFHDNDDGILTSNNPKSDIVIERSEFANNGHGDGFSHNIYIGGVRSFTLKFSYVHHARVGHNVKSRARTNFILYNRIMDEKTGTASYAIDLPNGGRSYVIGNVIQKGPNAENNTLIDYAEEGPVNAVQELYLVNNTMVIDVSRGVFAGVHGARLQVWIMNNIFAGTGNPPDGIGPAQHNLVSSDPKFVNKETFDYRLTATSPAINAGTDPSVGNGFNLTPVFQYVHPGGSEVRKAIGRVDLGAYEYRHR